MGFWRFPGDFSSNTWRSHAILPDLIPPTMEN
jgi:hypothetical protein